MNSNHSPLPWKIDDDGDLVDIDGQLVFNDLLALGSMDEEEAANVQLVVRSVNSVERMASTCKFVEKLLSEMSDNGRVNHIEIKMAIAHLQDARAQAEKGSQ